MAGPPQPNYSPSDLMDVPAHPQLFVIGGPYFVVGEMFAYYTVRQDHFTAPFVIGLQHDTTDVHSCPQHPLDTGRIY